MNAPGLVLFIDDDADLRRAAAQTLELVGWTVHAHASADTALRTLDEGFEGVVVSDIRMPGMDGHQLHSHVRALDPDLPVILITGHGDIPEAVRALQDGAYDFISKPFPTEHLVAVVNRALEKRRLVLENRRLHTVAEAPTDDLGLIGDSPAIQTLRAQVRQLAAAEVDVLLEGETGVGKELVARALHRESPRRRQPFVVVDCAALNPAHADMELFGHEAGAFAGAVRRRIGQIEASDTGTLFLDELEALTPSLQAKLLRVIEEREVTPIGANEPRALSLRIIASAKAGLAARVAGGDFRSDLYYRLDVGRIRVPALRERRGDILPLFSHFIQDACARLKRPVPEIGAAVRHRLMQEEWAGNVRELRHLAVKAVLGVEDGTHHDPTASTDLAGRVAAYEKHLMEEALMLCEGDARATTDLLGLPRKTFYDKLRRHGVEISTFRSK